MPSIAKLLLVVLAPLVYLFVCALLAAALAYPVYRLVGEGFGPMVNWGRLLLAVLGFALLAPRLGIDLPALGLDRLGWPFLHRLGLGFGLGILMLGLHVGALSLLGIRVLDHGTLADVGAWPGLFAKALAIGIAVALVEEILFRSALFAAIRSQAGAPAAVAVTAFYYAALHFLRSRFKPESGEIGWDAGFRMVADAFAQLAAPLPDAFLALLLAGILLGCIRAAWPQGLAYTIGLHAGWVFVIKSTKAWTDAAPSAPGYFLVSSYDGIIGYLAAAWMGLLVVLMGGMLWRRGQLSARLD